VFLYEHYQPVHFKQIINKSQEGSVHFVIKYDRLWETMKKRGITQYDLYTHHNINRSQLNRLRHNQNVEVNTIDRLCNILQCKVEEIMEHIPDENRF
jgi:DNA-binding Xre family transcriptional regulator